MLIHYRNHSGFATISFKNYKEPVLTAEPEYSGLTPLATIKAIIQRVDRPGTGTIFLLNAQGLTVVRSLAAEQEHQIEMWEKEGN